MLRHTVIQHTLLLLFALAALPAAKAGEADTAAVSVRVAVADTVSSSPDYALGDVVVTGTRNETDIRHLPMTLSVVGRKALETRYEPSIFTALNEQVPGLFTTSRGVMGYGVSDGAAGSISVRGIGGGAQMLVLIDGHPQYMGLFGHPISDACQTMLAERVEVLRGPASVLYGSNAMGGVINIVTRRQETDGVLTDIQAAAGSYGTLQTEAVNRVRYGRFSSIASISYNNTDGHRPDMGFEQYGGYAKLGYEISPNWDIYADVNITHFNASNPGPVDAPIYDNDSRITRGMTSLAIRNDYGRTSGSLSFFYNWGRHRINDGYSDGEAPQESLFNSRDMMMGLSLFQSASLFRGNRLTLGFDFQLFGGESWNSVIASGETVPGVKKSEYALAGYADFRQDLWSWLSLDAGLRVDHHSHVGTELVPQGGLAFHLPARAELKTMVSKGFRNPTIREMYMFPPQNPDLKPERLMNYEISFSQRQLGGRLSYGANIYYINGDNVIMTVREDGRPKNVNSGRIENWGAEVYAAWSINSHWRVNANYSWLHMEYPVISAPEHKLYAGVDFTHGRWSASTGVMYVAGLYTSVGETVSTEDFVLWNLRAACCICRHVSLYVKGENLLAQRYEIMAGYPMPGATFMGGVNVTF
ncbi:MAG: TonB-dependent receptor [bacterium]|uniref:TonB-dependent receptor n=1 Tax=Candidatus Aphodosoma intestinipullorum TaxID=2840674 RepID=A0A940DHR5_9BACT|nr:TonB-dependent receptor [Candidatus Aphodosoma intestinipullorum]